MNYILLPSLEHIALVKIVVTLWSQEDIKTAIANYSSLHLRNEREGKPPYIDSRESKKWREIREKVLQKITQLELPKCFKEKLFGIVKPVGLELLKWIKTMLHIVMYHEKHIDGKPCGLPNSACWTSLGTVDKKRSAEVLVKDKSIHIADRYILACNYCLEDDVRELWNSVPESVKTHFYSKELHHDGDELVVFWTHYLKGKLAKPTPKILYRMYVMYVVSPYVFGFKFAARCNNRAATEYFLKKLNPTEREKCLMEFKCYENHGDVLCFLLSQMNEEEKIAFFSRDDDDTFIYYMLRSLLEWPLQSFFKEMFATICCKFDHLHPSDFYAVLEIIMKKISGGIEHRDYNYQELLEQIWLLSPENCKEYVFTQWAKSFVPLVHDMAKERNIMLILNDATLHQREKINWIVSMMNENRVWEKL